MSKFVPKNRPAIIGTGHFLPDKEVTNADMVKILAASDITTTEGDIVDLTGIYFRRKAGKNIFMSDMAFNAAMKAIEAAADFLKDDLETIISRIVKIIVGTETPRKKIPDTASDLHRMLQPYGIKNCYAADTSAACAGFLYGIELAEEALLSGKYSEDALILVVGGDKLTDITNYQDRATCILFGDGAGAVILKNHETGLQVIRSMMFADGKAGSGNLELPIGKTGLFNSNTNTSDTHKLYMAGNPVMKAAIKFMAAATKSVLSDTGTAIDDVNWFLFHQANIRIIKVLISQLGIQLTDRVCVNIDKYGNTSSGTIGISLDEAIMTKKIKAGDIVLASAFGGGYRYGATLFYYVV